MLTVAHVNAESGWSGGEVQMFLLMEGLRARGHANVCVCRPGSRAASEAARRGFPTVEVPMRGDLDLGSAHRIARAYREHGVDVAQLHTGRATWLGGYAARQAGIPAVTTRRMDRRVKRGLRTKLIYGSWVAAAIAISPAVADCLRAGGVPDGRITVVWDAVEPDAYVAGGARDLRGEAGIGRGTTLLLVLAALVERKGIDVLVDALALLGERGVDARLWIGGDGEERAALEARCAERGVAHLVTFLGFREDKVDLLAACDVAVLPSRREGVGVAALEAMAAGKPVVASAVGGLGQAVVDGETGLLVPPDDPERLADAIERLASDAELRATLGAAGARRVRETFSAGTMVDGYLAVYERVLAAHREAAR